MTDYFKMFLIALVTAVASQLLITPYILRLHGVLPTEPVATAPKAPPSEPPAPPSVRTELAAPNLEGMTVTEARERWRERGLVVVEDGEREGSGAPPGTIVAQRPPPGAALSADSKEIRVIVAKEGEDLPVPEVVGLEYEKARTMLEKAGFDVADPTREASEEPKDSVLRQVPGANSRARRGSIVRLVVAETAALEVPKVSGMYLSKARRELENAGLELGNVRRVEHAELGEDYVLRQNPSPGEKVPPGTEIELVIVAPN